MLGVWLASNACCVRPPAPQVLQRSGSHSLTAMKHGQCLVLQEDLQRQPGNLLGPGGENIEARPHPLVEEATTHSQGNSCSIFHRSCGRQHNYSPGHMACWDGDTADSCTGRWTVPLNETTPSE